MAAKIMVGICTRGRPEMLSACLKTLDQQPGDQHQYMVFVVDNNDSPDSASRKVIEVHAAKSVHIPKPGIASARNAVIDAAIRYDMDYIAFVDDDEWASPHWLRDLRVAAMVYSADVVYAPVYLVYDDAPECWADGRTQKKWPPLPEGARTEHASSCNVLISRRVWGNRPGEMCLRFSTEYDLTGGEDSVFFTEAHRRHARMHWTNRAIVWERVPASRQTFGYQLRQQRQRGMVSIQMARSGYGDGDLLEFKPLAFLGCALVNAYRLLLTLRSSSIDRNQWIVGYGGAMAFAWGQFLGRLGRRSKFYRNIHGG
jgi:succinoglycan biosynthesis protein ExoM